MERLWRDHLRLIARVGLVVLMLASDCLIVLAIIGLAASTGLVDRGIAP
jgi:hypothetical protein